MLLLLVLFWFCCCCCCFRFLLTYLKAFWFKIFVTCRCYVHVLLFLLLLLRSRFLLLHWCCQCLRFSKFVVFVFVCVCIYACFVGGEGRRMCAYMRVCMCVVLSSFAFFQYIRNCYFDIIAHNPLHSNTPTSTPTSTTLQRVACLITRPEHETTIVLSFLPSLLFLPAENEPPPPLTMTGDSTPPLSVIASRQRPMKARRLADYMHAIFRYCNLYKWHLQW